MAIEQPDAETKVVLSSEGMNDNEFLAYLRKTAEDWRYSDAFIGLIVRRRFPRR